MDLDIDHNQTSNYDSKIEELEEIEIFEQDQTNEDVFKQLLIYYILEDQPLKAKFLWKRIPKNLIADQQSELNKIWSLVQLIIQRQYSQAFSVAYQFNKQSWSNSQLQNLFQVLIEKNKERLLDLISVGYSSISLNEFSTLFSLSNDEAIKLAVDHGWSIDETRSFLTPKKKKHEEVVEILNQLQMQQLTSIVSFLET